MRAAGAASGLEAEAAGAAGGLANDEAGGAAGVDSGCGAAIDGGDGGEEDECVRVHPGFRMVVLAKCAERPSAARARVRARAAATGD